MVFVRRHVLILAVLEDAMFFKRCTHCETQRPLYRTSVAVPCALQAAPCTAHDDDIVIVILVRNTSEQITNACVLQPHNGAVWSVRPCSGVDAGATVVTRVCLPMNGRQ